jgi:hypothetical protein
MAAILESSNNETEENIMTITLKKWTNPTTGQVRVYMTGFVFQDYDDKIWVEKKEADCFGQDWTVKTKIGYITTNKRSLVEKAENAFGCVDAEFDVKCFDDIVALAK